MVLRATPPFPHRPFPGPRRSRRLLAGVALALGLAMALPAAGAPFSIASDLGVTPDVRFPSNAVRGVELTGNSRVEVRSDGSFPFLIRRDASAGGGVLPEPAEFHVTATGDSTALTISGIGASVPAAGPTAFSLTASPLDIVLERTVDPPGFDPPFTETFDFGELETRIELETTVSLVAASSYPTLDIDPVDLTTRSFTLATGQAVLDQAAFTTFVDGAMVRSVDLAASQQIDFEILARFACESGPGGPSCTPQYVGTFSNTPPFVLVDEPSFEDLFGTPLPDGFAFSSIQQAVFVPEPSATALALATVAGLVATSRGRAPRGWAG